ncbi:acid protease [Microstroma glucosiphilum]|uniref:Acid protease n=1 Tax=Pseudomicrostroma glucosiphilum TaxID=1684307 RepID=A0A316TYX4_9BASI|nr:acid protease [Pseudomicrostroma glucosiphilum]PWN18449.1 acid protease [Pseudomicrostroma glucosiphilum]
MQGLVGLALPGQDSASPLGGFFERVVKAGVLKENIFSFALAPGGVGELQFGSVAEAAVAPPKWLPVLPDRPGEWLVKGSINGLERRMLLDTGSSTILGRKEDVLPIFEKLQDFIDVLEDPDGSIFAVLKDSSKLPTFTFTFGDFSFRLGKDALSYGTMPDGRQALSIMGDVIMEKFPKDVWIVGDAALREVVYTCDWDGKRVGFSPHKNTIVV